MRVIMPGRRKPRLSKKLMRRAGRGDSEAFADLVEATRPRLEAVVHLRLGKRLRQVVDPEDVLQETYLRAFRSLARFQYRDRPAALRWLLTMAEHVIVEFARFYFEAKKRCPPGPESPVSRSPRTLTYASQVWGFIPVVGTTPSDAALRKERFDRLERALESLSPEHREVIVLARIQDLKIQDIAERMGRSPEAVSMLLLRAVRKLRQVFGKTDSWRLPPERIAGWSLPAQGSTHRTGPENEVRDA